VIVPLVISFAFVSASIACICKAIRTGQANGVKRITNRHSPDPIRLTHLNPSLLRRPQ